MLSSSRKSIVNLWRSSGYGMHVRASISSKNSFSSTAEDQGRTAVQEDTEMGTTTALRIVNTKDTPIWPMYQVLNRHGKIMEGATDPHIEEKTLTRMYELMGRIRAFDDIMYNVQRQGRISFYMQSLCEEATHIGSASAMQKQDLALAQYREVGVLFWRGFTVQQAADQCFSNEADNGKGRQMPVHYGSKELNFQTISSPLATQIPQAVGAAYHFKRINATLEDKTQGSCAICYFGEGAASEGDFHAALNFGATLEVPVIFFCRNNGYAISTPVKDQYRGDGIVSRAAGYGIRAIRVDGNDLFAVKMATEEARRIAIEENVPVLIEAMTYRGGHHSTSDDSTRYRSVNEIKYWMDNYDPMTRIRLYMEDRDWWNEDKELLMKDTERMNAMNALTVAEKRAKPDFSEMFTDVYETKTQNLNEQESELREHISRHSDYYHSDSH